MTTDTLAAESPVADLDDVPLALMPSLGLDVLGKVIGRALPDPLVNGLPRRFQSSI